MVDVDTLVRAWTDTFEREVLEYSRPDQVTNEEVFADSYHSLVHSELTDTMLRLEHSHAEAIAEKCERRDQEIRLLQARQEAQMAEAVAAAASSSGTSEQVNELAARHLEERQVAELRWESDLAHTRDTQRREFRQWVMCVHEQSKTMATSATSALHKSDSAFSMESLCTAAPAPLQESFTVTLGAQMKQMHNLRLVAAHVLDLCRYPRAQEDALPKRLQTDMSLYSNNLCGLVLLTDGRISAFSGLGKDLGDMCQRSTEFHFQSLESQLQSIKEELVSPAVKWRNDFKKKHVSVRDGQQSPDKETTSLKSGDFYVTRHSNLCETHILFHMVVCDDMVTSGGINSRHPVIMGLRNVLKTASLSDVTTLTIPLLLSHHMSEEMTVQWCMKRAELVFKCVKGFMMEVASWGGSDIKTLQFLVPRDIDQEVFTRLTGILASIFRTSNPIREK